uniref:Uncharacterized protein n=1 Tax=Stomoxys calcitrans TaxID=35570 RepID=A0A1I8NXI3_STOCA
MQVKRRYTHCSFIARSLKRRETIKPKKYSNNNKQPQIFTMSENAITSSTTTLGPLSGALGAHVLPSSAATATNSTSRYYDMNIRINEDLTASASETGQLKHVINEKIKNKEFFYGLEIMARTYEPNVVLDYKSLGPLMPLFTSIVWLGMDYWQVENLADIGAINLARQIKPHMMVLPHFSCYRLTEDRLRKFLDLNFPNVLSVRGDYYDTQQAYKYSSELVTAIRSIRGDTITIGVAGYPEGHPECKSVEEDMDNLVRKVSAGADFIITQICFSSRAIIDFIRRCRAKDIKIPILVGIFVPDNFRMLEAMLRITQIRMPAVELEEYRQHSILGRAQFTEFAIKRAAEMIDAILHSNEVEVYGLQFFSMNKFENIPKVLEKIMQNKNNI